MTSTVHASQPPRIVSLLPGATEMVCALGLGDCLVGRSHECDYPPQVLPLPVVSRPRLDPSASGAVIDRAVRTLVSQGLGVFEVDTDTLRELAPDVIITQVQCEVCAVSEDDVRDAVAIWTGREPAIVSLSANDLAGVWRDIEACGAALDRGAASAALTRSLQARLAALRETTAALVSRPTVVGVEWVTPLMSSGNWVPELIADAGGTALLAQAGEHSPWIDWEALRASDPDVLLVSPCGFDLQRSTAATTELSALPGWATLKAVRNRRVYAFDGHQYLHRPGPRLVDSAELIARVLHPGLELPSGAMAADACARID